MANNASSSNVYRLVTAAFGLLFVVLALAIIVASDCVLHVPLTQALILLSEVA